MNKLLFYFGAIFFFDSSSWCYIIRPVSEIINKFPILYFHSQLRELNKTSHGLCGRSLEAIREVDSFSISSKVIYLEFKACFSKDCLVSYFTDHTSR